MKSRVNTLNLPQTDQIDAGSDAPASGQDSSRRHHFVSRLNISGKTGRFPAASACRPAQGMCARLRKSGWGGRVRTSEWRNQNPLPYHLATPQQGPEASSGRPRETRRNIPASPEGCNRAAAADNRSESAGRRPGSRLRARVLAAITPPRIGGGVWRSLVAHLVRDEGVAGSNPATPTSRPFLFP